MLEKPKRTKDRKFLDEVAKMPCTTCPKRGPSDPDHIISRGAGGGDTPENVWPLCRECHTKRHQLGLSQFAWRYPRAREALIARGFSFDNEAGRWRKP